MCNLNPSYIYIQLQEIFLGALSLMKRNAGK